MEYIRSFAREPQSLFLAAILTGIVALVVALVWLL